MHREKIKVLYIAGFERSGSTLINRVLGQIDGFVAWGEIRDIWEHGVIQNRLCSCGAKFHNCEAWSSILDLGFEGISEVESERLLSALRETKRYVAANHIWPANLEAPEEVQFYLQNLSKLYAAIQSYTDCRVIVDSTKASWYGAVLRELSDLDVYVLHVTRDPRSVCHSLRRRKLEGEPECTWYNPVHASISWTLKNAGVESFLSSPSHKYLRVKFEDFVAQPQMYLEQVLKILNEPVPDLSFISKDSVVMKTDHIFTGSPSSRSKVGNIKLRVDERWKKEMKAFDKIAIGLLTAGFQKKYNYM